MVAPRLVLPRGTSASEDWLPGSKRVIDPNVLVEAKDAMSSVVEQNNGTARKAVSDKYRMYGKTGTAELSIPGTKGYDRSRYTASFLAAAPLENSRLVVLCVIDDPDKKKGHYGGTIAAPVVRDVVTETLEYLGVPYDQVQEKRAKGASKVAAR
jgi:cell division protein FtsI/penicillin-binding protein 2